MQARHHLHGVLLLPLVDEIIFSPTVCMREKGQSCTTMGSSFCTFSGRYHHYFLFSSYSETGREEKLLKFPFEAFQRASPLRVGRERMREREKSSFPPLCNINYLMGFGPSLHLFSAASSSIRRRNPRVRVWVCLLRCPGNHRNAFRSGLGIHELLL